MHKYIFLNGMLIFTFLRKHGLSNECFPLSCNKDDHTLIKISLGTRHFDQLRLILDMHSVRINLLYSSTCKTTCRSNHIQCMDIFLPKVCSYLHIRKHDLSHVSFLLSCNKYDHVLTMSSLGTRHFDQLKLILGIYLLKKNGHLQFDATIDLGRNNFKGLNKKLVDLVDTGSYNCITCNA